MSDIIEKSKICSMYKEFFETLKNGNTFYRLGKMFKTSNNYYLYDTGTGKVFALEEDVFQVMECLFNTDTFESIFDLGLEVRSIELALEEIKSSVENENILLAPPVTEFSGPQSLALDNHLEYGLNQLTLEVTERCNLRCKYCIYQDDHNDFRTFTNQDMTLDVAKEAIQFLYRHSEEKVYISFYGGEPLLRFELIKECVEYAKDLFHDREVHFALTTNGTLISKEIADFFEYNNFSITVSLDGPEEIHDENRIFENEVGSFKYALEGLKLLVDTYGEKSNYMLFISMVTSGPNYNEKYDKIQEFFRTEQWLSNITVNASYVSYGRFKEEYAQPNATEEKSYLENVNIDPALDWYIDKQDMQFNKNKLFINANMKKNLHIIHRRDLSYTPMENYYFNGCCVPGGRRLHVKVNGDFLPCERVGEVPPLGNIQTGFNLQEIRKHYIQDFMDEAVKYCKNCWAVHLCTSCYVECFDKDKVNLDYRHRSCRYIRYMLERNLILYHEILEKDPESLRILNDVIIE